MYYKNKSRNLILNLKSISKNNHATFEHSILQKVENNIKFFYKVQSD